MKSRFIQTRELIRVFSAMQMPWIYWLIIKITKFDLAIENEYIILLSILIFGPMWCGWLCPFGNFSHFIGLIGKKYFPGIQIKLPSKVDKPLRYLKYLMLALFLFVIVINKIDYFTFDHYKLYKMNILTQIYLKLKIVAVLFAPIIFSRFFCKYLCYQKAFYNICNKVFSFFRIQRDESTCISCKKCDRSCEMDIPISEKKSVIGNDCIGCMNCVEDSVCPVNECLSLHFLKWKISPTKLSGFVLVMYYLSSIAFLLFAG